MKFKTFYDEENIVEVWDLNELGELLSLHEFEENLKKKVVVLMGLPASGKSTFINDDMPKHLPDFKNFKVTNSEGQVRALQFNRSKEHFTELSKIKNEKEYIEWVKNKEYKTITGKLRTFPFTWDEMQEILFKGPGKFWKTLFKPFYATYFDIRDMAKEADEKLFAEKVRKSGNLLVIDTVASNPETIFKRLNKLRDANFFIILIYLEIDPKLAIIRDIHRGDKEGRTVGSDVILGYAPRMERAYKAYKAEGVKDNGRIDELMRFKWIPQGDDPRKGKWKTIEKINFLPKRKIKAKKTLKLLR